MARRTLLAGWVKHRVCLVSLAGAVLTLLPIHANAARAGSETKSLEPTMEEVTFANGKDVLAGTGKSSGNTLLQSRADRAREAAEAIRFLRTKRGTDPRHIGLWGGSEGASIALLAAAPYPREVSFAVPVSGGVGAGGGSVFEQMYHAAECFAVDHNLISDEMQKIVTFEQLCYAFPTGPNGRIGLGQFAGDIP